MEEENGTNTTLCASERKKKHNKTRQILKTMTFRMFLSVDVKLYEVRTIVLDGATSNF